MKERIKEEIVTYVKLLPHTLAIITGWELGKWIIKLGSIFISNFL